MSVVLGLSVGRRSLHAVVARPGAIRWAGRTGYTGPEDLSAAIGRLASECPGPPRRARAVLERDIVQMRTVSPAPALRSADARAYVSLEARRLFRGTDGATVVDGRVVRTAAGERALLAAATSESIARALLDGCAQAGVRLTDVSTTADVLPSVARGNDPVVVFPNGASAETIELGPDGAWRSRHVPHHSRPASEWLDVLDVIGPGAGRYAAAYGAVIAGKRLSLLPSDARAVRERARRRRLAGAIAVGIALWATAGIVDVVRLRALAAEAERTLTALGPAVDSVGQLGRDLRRARSALTTMRETEARRSRVLPMLGRLSAEVGDSAFLSSLALQDSTLRLAGYATSGAAVLKTLGAMPELRRVRFEVPIAREHVQIGAQRVERERFSVAAKVVASP